MRLRGEGDYGSISELRLARLIPRLEGRVKLVRVPQLGTGS